MIATSGFLTALQCIKFVFGRDSAPDPAWGEYSAPQALADLRGLTSKGEFQTCFPLSYNMSPDNNRPLQ